MSPTQQKANYVTSHDDFSDDSICVPRALHRAGLAALSGAETTLLQARISIGELSLELHAAQRKARERGCDTSGFQQAVAALNEMSRDILARRGALQEFHREFRACDSDLTPARPSSDQAFIAFQQSSNFQGKNVKR